jgi:hypothetical protein
LASPLNRRFNGDLFVSAENKAVRVQFNQKQNPGVLVLALSMSNVDVGPYIGLFVPEDLSQVVFNDGPGTKSGKEDQVMV